MQAMDRSRREFLARFGGAVLACGCSFSLLDAIVSAASEKHTAGAVLPKQLGMVIDIQKCLDERVRRACVEACILEHNIPDIPDPKEEVKWIWSEPFENTFPERVHPYTTALLKEKPVLVLCNHCTNPACVKVCRLRLRGKEKKTE
jgi:Fe-S-cluster-containing dehydrogenase component